MGYISPWGRKESDTTERLHFTLYLVLLCFVGTVSYKLRICGNPVWSKSVSTIFPPALAYFMSLSHFGNSHNM